MKNVSIRKLCSSCNHHRALFRFRFRGEVRFEKHHDLCFFCDRSAMNRLAAMAMLSNLDEVKR